MAIGSTNGKKVVPGPDDVLQEGAELVLVGKLEAEERFLEEFGVTPWLVVDGTRADPTSQLRFESTP